jgi:polysaccharide pyruvyl transferase WcaK-like protein
MYTYNNSPIDIRNDWIDRLVTDLKIQSKGSAHLKVGIVGALGSGDAGDEAMLIALTSELRDRIPNIEILCFSLNPGLTYSFTGIVSERLLEGILSPNRNIFYGISLLLNRIEISLTRFLIKHWEINVVDRGGWLLRFYYLFLTKWLLLSHSLSMKRGKLTNYINKIASLDAVVYLGGAYINSWNVKSSIYSYLFPARVAIKYNTPVYASGLNLGPYNVVDRHYVKNILKEFRLVGLRDFNESVAELKQMGIFNEEKHFYSTDDAINLKADWTDSLKHFINEASPYIAVNFHYWNLSTSEWKDFSHRVADIIRNVVEQYDFNIVPVPMAFSDFSEVLDIAAIRDIVALTGLPESRFKLPPKPLTAAAMKSLYENASVTIATRHHAMVLSVSSKTPTIAIAFDRYYRMKHEGVGQYYRQHFYVCNSASIKTRDVVKQINIFLSSLSVARSEIETQHLRD